jgi:hypothetical protein
MAGTRRMTTAPGRGALRSTQSITHVVNAKCESLSRRLLKSLRQSTPIDRIELDDLLLTRLSEVPRNACLRAGETLVFFSTEAPLTYELRGASQLYDVPDGAVFVVRSQAVLELADGHSTMTIGSGIWFVRAK